MELEHVAMLRFPLVRRETTFPHAHFNGFNLQPSAGQPLVQIRRTTQ